MQNFHEMLFTRHSIRKYTDEELTAEEVKIILEAALLAPSSKSGRPWQFVVVEDKEMLQKLATCKPMGAAPLSKCSLAIVVTADPTKSDVWVEDASVAATYMQLQAETMGLSSCWVQIRLRTTSDDHDAQEPVKQLLNIPDLQQVLCIITLGHKDEVRRPVDPEKLQWEKVHIGTYKGGDEE